MPLCWLFDVRNFVSPTLSLGKLVSCLNLWSHRITAMWLSHHFPRCPNASWAAEPGCSEQHSLTSFADVQAPLPLLAGILQRYRDVLEAGFYVEKEASRKLGGLEMAANSSAQRKTARLEGTNWCPFQWESRPGAVNNVRINMVVVKLIDTIASEIGELKQEMVRTDVSLENGLEPAETHSEHPRALGPAHLQRAPPGPRSRTSAASTPGPSVPHICSEHLGPSALHICSEHLGPSVLHICSEHLGPSALHICSEHPRALGSAHLQRAPSGPRFCTSAASTPGPLALHICRLQEHTAVSFLCSFVL
ncbi:hypothetical protein P7K49_009260 [Saguinus oedipus]|uniref:Uncharacterized protein n=1 Tax=Saguinus oedipus TaxID=9490 RepID=A0ABQ9VJG5_SAGOE|nr:hypothetical protein P7K49_009260 [Saguinus oedipus]